LTVCSARLIPAATAAELRSQYALLPEHDETPAKLANSENIGTRFLYNQLLQNELLDTNYRQEVDWSPGAEAAAAASTPLKELDISKPRLSPTGQVSPSRLLSYQYASPERQREDIWSLQRARSPLSPASASLLSGPSSLPMRKISKTPFKVLEAPQIQDDFYLSLVDWSSLNVLAVGLGSTVYLWQPSTGTVSRLLDVSADGDNEHVTSISWMARGTHLAVGTNVGTVTLWDVQHQKKVRTFGGHTSRVGCMAWASSPPWLLSTGSRDHTVLHRDVRSGKDSIARLNGHRQEICGLKWGINPGNYLASGGNDNRLLVWDQRLLTDNTTPQAQAKCLYTFTSHKAAVKAITWSPHQRGLLASGGGTADQCLRFWNTLSGTELQHVDTSSQVCNVHWSRNCDELVSTHGYSLNQIIVWSWPSMRQVTQLTGHTMRVLYLAVSPDGTTIVTGAGDETLRFWNIFPKSTGTASGASSSPAASATATFAASSAIR